MNQDANEPLPGSTPIAVILTLSQWEGVYAIVDAFRRRHEVESISGPMKTYVNTLCESLKCAIKEARELRR